MEDVRKAGVVFPKEYRDKPLPGAPKYDPETGELINPLGVEGSAPPDPSTIPVAKRVVTYAAVSTEQTIRLRNLPLAMFQPINVFVMFCILCMHVFMQMSMLIIAFGGGILNIPICFVMFCLMIAHYATVVDETGPENKDELPRPLRHCDWRDDLWGPFSRAVGAFLLAFFPAILMLTSHSLPWPLRLSGAAAFAFVGNIFFPAILLTNLTSGTLNNIRPDRVLGVIAAIGIRYLIPVALFPITCFIYLYGIIGSLARGVFFMLLPPGTSYGWWLSPTIVYSSLLAGIYLMHLYGWVLGVFYRKHYPDFPWVLQRHIPTRLKERIGLPDPKRLRRVRPPANSRTP
jgi:hypothetical protein